MARRKLGYKPALDGLRAVSVLAVILYHAGVASTPGGFLGVEVFFVVSGFLITALLVEERMHSGTIDLRHFWVRRARRLLPALYLLLTVVIVAALVVYKDAAGRLGGDVLAALFYVSNWWNIFLNESYFAQAGRPPLLRHLWSLAVEEQFYLLFPPLFMVALRRFRMARIRLGLLVLSIASSVAMAVLFTPYSDPSRVYYGTDTRAAGMLLGALLATIWAPWRSTGSAKRSAVWALDGVGAIATVSLVVFITRVNEFDSFIYRGGFLLLDVVCILLIAVLVHPASRITRLWEFKPLVWIGVRSYAIYLWHWPIFQVTRPELDLPWTGLPLMALRIGLTVAAAELSFRFIEQPFRKGLLGNLWKQLSSADDAQRIAARRALLGAGTVAVIAALVLGAGLANASSHSKRTEREASAYLAPPGTGTVPHPVVSSSSTLPDSSVETPPTTLDPSGDADPGGTTSSTAPPVTTPPPADGSDVVAVGDSVMLGASGAIKERLPGMRIDAKVGRQFKDVLAVVDWYQRNGFLRGPLVVHMGTNGVFSDEDMDRLVAAAGDRKVVLVNAKVARPWQQLVNDRIRAAVERHKNVALADWYSLSSAHPEWFANDGAHLRPDGAAAFADLIAGKL